jgi:hypothetical protein
MIKISLPYGTKPNRMYIKIDSDMIEQLRTGDVIMRDDKRYKIHALSELEIMAMRIGESQLTMLPVLHLIGDDWFIEKKEQIVPRKRSLPLRNSL